MIKIPTPVVKDYAPKTQPIAYIAAMFLPQQLANGQFRLNLNWNALNAQKQIIPIDHSSLQGPSADQLAGALTMPATAGDTFEQDQSRRALDFVKTNLGLDTAVVE